MSTKHPDVHKDRSRGTEFQPLTQPTIFERNDLHELRTADPRDGDGPLAFAVAARHGLRQDFAAEREWESHCVLYLTADGERCVDLFVRGVADDHSTIPRVIRVDEDTLSPTEGFAARVAPAVRRHPEVGE